jgi:hypothetical protein
VKDKLLVVCSRQSLRRAEVVEEIIEAIEQERKHGARKLFPLRLDDSIISDEAEAAMDALPPRQQREDWLTYLRAYHIPDFRKWKDHDAYQVEFAKLLKALKSPAARV